MNEKVKNVLLVASGGTALALSGAAVAGAADDGSSGGSTTSADQDASADRSGSAPRRAGEELLTGDTAARVREAALARISGGTIERVETDADGHARYEAHMRDADGNPVTVYVDESFDVVEVESGR